MTSTIRNVEPGGPMGHLVSGSWTRGVDARHRFSGGDWELTAKLLGSHLTGSTAAIDRLQRSPNRYFQRPDDGHSSYDSTRTSQSGASPKLNLLKIGGHWRGGIHTQLRTPGFEVNDPGFQQGADRAGGIAWIGYRSLGPSGPFRDWNLNVNGWSEWTLGGERVMTGGNMNGWFQLTNHWRGHAGIN